ncbi:hypothetical protein OAG71_00530 [bacterium]|nr:hypothetical protein [bacterium]
MLLIESHLNETDDSLRTAVDHMLTHVWELPESDWWHPYELVRTFEYSSRRFRQFSCPAGIVHAHLLRCASSRGVERALITIGSVLNDEKVGKIITNCHAESLNPNDFHEV